MDASSSSIRDKLRMKLSKMTERRTGIQKTTEKVSRQERQKIQRDVRKEGVRALTKKLGIDKDPELEKIITQMIRSGEATNPQHVIDKINAVKTARERQQFNNSTLSGQSNSASQTNPSGQSNSATPINLSSQSNSATPINLSSQSNFASQSTSSEAPNPVKRKIIQPPKININDWLAQ